MTWYLCLSYICNVDYYVTQIVMQYNITLMHEQS